jgi:hypothetical protein
MSGVVIVGVGVDLEIPRNELPEQPGPVLQVIRSVVTAKSLAADISATDAKYYKDNDMN